MELMEDSQEKDYSFLGFPNLYDALVYERKFKSEYLERQIHERSLKSEPSIVKPGETYRESKRTLIKLLFFIYKRNATRRSRWAREEICLQKYFND